MSDSSYQDDANSLDFALTTQLPEEVSILFAQLDAQVVEQFYQSYQLWAIQQRIEDLKVQIAALREEIVQNAERMKRILPTPTALAMLAQLQATGVEDVDLLDRMLERGDIWLGYAMRLLERCEQLGIVHDNYTVWCEHALAGAYDWLDTPDRTATTPSPSSEKEVDDSFIAQTATLLLQKLISDDEQTESLPSLIFPKTQLDPVVVESLPSDMIEEVTQALVAPTRPPESITGAIDAVALNVIEADTNTEEVVSPEITMRTNGTTSSTIVEDAHTVDVAQANFADTAQPTAIVASEDPLSIVDETLIDNTDAAIHITLSGDIFLVEEDHHIKEEILTEEDETTLDPSAMKIALAASTSASAQRIDSATHETGAFAAQSAGEQEQLQASEERKSSTQANFIKRSWAKIFRD